MAPHATAGELVEAWDRGETIWTLDMGGMGPGYEQAIQIAAVEFARANLGFTRTDDEKADTRRFEAACTETLHAIDEDLGGLSRAMFWAATWLAWQWVCNGGPQALIERSRANDQIQCSRWWPRAPKQGAGDGE